MRRSIFARIAVMLMIVLMLGISITGAVFWYVLESNLVEDKAVLLKQSGNRIVETLRLYLENQDSVLAPLLFRSFLSNVGSHEDSMIWIALDNGTLVMTSELPELFAGRMERVGATEYRLPDERQYLVGASANGDYLKGDFYGLFRGTGMEWLTVRIPFTFQNMPPYGLDLNGLVLLHAKMPEIRSTRNTILRLFALSAASGILISLLAGFLLSRRLAAPLRQMSRAAKHIALGEFTERLDVRAQDEFGQLAQSFNEMVDALSHLEEIRRDFVSNVSHELRTPLTSIKGFVDGMLDGTVPPERREPCLRIVREEAHRMNRMVNDLLDLTKMDSGGTALNPTAFDICERVRICVISLQQALEEKNLQFEADFEEERMYIHADRDAIQRLLLNLMQNAVKFTPSEGSIHVSVRRERDKTVVSIRDTGVGIAPEDLPFVFDRFYKTDKSRSTDRAGVGIGLAIVRSIILAHHEDIKVTSTLGIGTEFVFTMPTEHIQLSEGEWVPPIG